jgi:hypothetical protein
MEPESNSSATYRRSQKKDEPQLPSEAVSLLSPAPLQLLSRKKGLALRKKRGRIFFIISGKAEVYSVGEGRGRSSFCPVKARPLHLFLRLIFREARQKIHQ